MKTTGEILKKARESKELSINEVAHALKISTKFLKAIESGDTKNLPATTFLRGFVKSYASYLKLDVEKIVSDLNEELGLKPSPKGTPSVENITASQTLPYQTTPASPESLSTAQAPHSLGSNDPALKPLTQPQHTKAVALTLLGILLFSLIVFTKKTVDRYSRESEINATPVIPLETVETNKTEEILTETLAQKNEMEAPKNPALSSPSSTETPSITEPTPPSSSESNGAIKPDINTLPKSSTPIELILEAKGAVEVEYSIQGGKTNRIKMSTDQLHTFKSQNGLLIKLSNGGAVNLILNGKDLGTPGENGKALQLKYE